MIFGEKDFCGKWGQSHKKIEKATSEQFSLLQVPGMFRKREIHITSDHHAIKKSTNKKKMTEKITSLRAQRGGATATTLCRKWQALPKSMKSNALRLLSLLAILFIPAMRANAEEWDMITCLNVNQDLRQSQTSDKGLATITMTNNSWFYWEQKKVILGPDSCILRVHRTRKVKAITLNSKSAQKRDTISQKSSSVILKDAESTAMSWGLRALQCILPKVLSMTGNLTNTP